MRTCCPIVETLEDRLALAPILSIGDVAIVEGNAGTHNALVAVTLSGARGKSISVNYKTADGTAQAGSDYNAVSGQLTFGRNEISKSIVVPIRGDRVVEFDEYFSVQLSKPTKGTTIANGTGSVIIVDDEPRISVNDVSVSEGNADTTALTFTVSLSAAYDLPVTVNYATADDSATSASGDYVPVSGTLTFQPGKPTSQDIAVLVNGDQFIEESESLHVNLSTPNSYAAISKAVGVGAVIDDEPRISINDVSALEGNDGTTALTFTVSLSAAYDSPVTVNYVTADGSATAAGGDYVANSGTLTFEPGQPTSQDITVLVNGDLLFEEYETVLVNLSTPNSYAKIINAVAVGTIIDDEPHISVADAYIYEGDVSPFTFTVSLSAASNETVTVDFTTADGTALAGVDYVFAAGTLTFAPGVTTMTVTIDVLDSTYYDNKYFTIYLSNPSTNALVQNEVAHGYWSYYYYYYYYDYGYDWGYYYEYGYYYGA